MDENDHWERKGENMRPDIKHRMRERGRKRREKSEKDRKEEEKEKKRKREIGWMKKRSDVYFLEGPADLSELSNDFPSPLSNGLTVHDTLSPGF